ncbi:MAG: hypothetical protein KDD66_09600 [Bdellovibrionales bacterium]|nr:hypothetical protein [Bdellovibrionales bacterium]
MDLVHLHLVLTHFPIAGTIFALTLIVLSMIINREDLLVSAMLILVLSAALAIPLYLTGEAAEDAIEHLAGVSEHFLELHEDAAELSFFLLEGLGIFAAVGLGFHLSKVGTHSLFPKALLLGTLIVTGSIAWTSNLGGKIRHSEIRGNTANQQTKPVPSPKHDDSSSLRHSLVLQLRLYLLPGILCVVHSRPVFYCPPAKRHG